MRFNSEAYEKAFPRKAPEAKSPEIVKPGNILEEADKVVTPEPEKTPEPENAPELASESGDPGGGVDDGN